MPVQLLTCNNIEKRKRQSCSYAYLYVHMTEMTEWQKKRKRSTRTNATPQVLFMLWSGDVTSTAKTAVQPTVRWALPRVGCRSKVPPVTRRSMARPNVLETSNTSICLATHPPHPSRLGCCCCRWWCWYWCCGEWSCVWYGHHCCVVECCGHC